MEHKNDTYRLPFDGQQHISSVYGMRTLNGVTRMHRGLDIVADGDKRIHPVIGGVVESSTIVTDKANPTWEWGNYVKVRGDDGRHWFFCHMASRAVKVGQRVEKTDVLGIMGSTGYSTGQHTHLEARDAAGNSLNPAGMLGISNRKQTLIQGEPCAPVQPDNPRDVADWDAEGCDFIVTATRGDRDALRSACADIQLPVRNAT